MGLSEKYSLVVPGIVGGKSTLVGRMLMKRVKNIQNAINNTKKIQFQRNIAVSNKTAACYFCIPWFWWRD